MSTLRRNVPWWARIGAKVVLSRLPVPYGAWKRLGLFEHGAMDRPDAAIETFLSHATAAGVLSGGRLRPLSGAADEADGFAFVELGPGDSMASALIGHVLGASRSWLVDAGRYATTSVEAYRRIAAALRSRGWPIGSGLAAGSTESMLEHCNARYLVDGIDSMARIPSASVDYGFSNAVLEHVPAEHFDRMVSEWARILRPGAVALHRVDLKDHLGGGLNNLRFSDAMWDSSLFRRSGFYTNRIRYGDIIDRFRSAGFAVEVIRCERWPRVPISRALLAPRFASIDDDDLRVSGFDIRIVRVPGRARQAVAWADGAKAGPTADAMAES
jgi:SAM-dependent methyltransferase